MGAADLRGAGRAWQRRFRIDLDQPHLADGGAGLQFMHGTSGRRQFPAQALHAFRRWRRTTSTTSAWPLPGDLPRPVGDGGEVEALRRCW